MEIKEAYEQYFNTVYGYLSTLTGGNHSLAEELTQETFYRATKKISEFRGDAKMSTWLCQIAKFVYYQSLDKKRRRKEVSFDEAVEIAMHEETQQVIQQHLLECESCRQTYEDMTRELDITANKKKKKKNRRHKYRKKNLVRIWILGYLLVLALIMAFCIIDMCLFF